MNIQSETKIVLNLTVAAIAWYVLTFTSANAALIGHWKLDEGTGTVAADSSTFGNNASKTGSGGSWVTSGAPAGNAYDFPGGGTNYFGVTMGPELPTGAAERTITAWINPDNANLDRKFLGYGTGSGGAFSFTVEANGIRFRHGGGNITYGSVTANTWTHVAMRVPAGASLTGDLDVFINGVEAAVTGTGGGGGGVTLNTAATQFRIGDWAQNNSFDGSIDDVQFYDAALSDAEILYLFNNPGQPIPEPSTFTLCVLALLGLLGWGRRRRR